MAASAKSLSVDPFSLVTTCTVICPLKVTDINKCSTISQLKSPIESPAKSKSYPKYGRFDKSMITSTSLPFTEAEPLPIRLHPALFPNASFKHWPTVMATSSVVWWSSIQVSPDATHLNVPNSAVSANALNNPSNVSMPVDISTEPFVPPFLSKSNATSMLVSLVLLARLAARLLLLSLPLVSLPSFPSISSINFLRHLAKLLNVASTM
mmetsp:Transcript_9526/g.27460  ORF Transcript_9526/g.27460 Transcript_9526/m.27460 type:complete len:209 (-) Transcript_9526:820-1446(-)